ncbi:MAG: flagellar FlbD family protein [Treponema sp.]|nr:flagellar FlbD family protein [Treponema sp.]
MIEVLRLNGDVFYINPHLIESMQCRPDLTITMMSGKTVVVKNSPEEIIQKIVDYRKKIGADSQEV